MPEMTNRSRFISALNGKTHLDRLPRIEWCSGILWWDKTVNRWRNEGLPEDIKSEELDLYFGLDRVVIVDPDYYKPGLSIRGGCISNMQDYKELKEVLYPPSISVEKKERLIKLKELHDKGDIIIWMPLTGFFALARHFLGIQRHFYTFFDDPELMHAINRDLADFLARSIEEICEIVEPDFMTFAEDMSYNHGSMISYELYNEFMMPYYRQIIPILKKHNIIPFIDSDGNIEDIIPWFMEAGIEGILPVERQAGCDISRMKERYPDFMIIGGYDKMVMSMNEMEMRKEFERLLPAMKSGRFIPSVDHQTPPEVSLENYRIYLKLLEEYSQKAMGN